MRPAGQHGRLVIENLATGSCTSHATMRCAPETEAHDVTELMGQTDSSTFPNTTSSALSGEFLRWTLVRERYLLQAIADTMIKQAEASDVLR